MIKGIAVGVTAVLLIAIAVWLAVVYTGTYNVEHGIKMTGMPTFGPHHEDSEILAITAFVTRLPGLSPEDYWTMTGERGTAMPSEQEDRSSFGQN